VPLRAVVDGEPVTGPDLSRDEWKALQVRHRKGLPITMACCGAPGHVRTSGAGTQHFYHASGTGCRYEQESKEHLEIKYRIYRACRSEGWETSVEFPAPDRTWISDVCAARDGRTIVFEVQTSAISPDDLEERDRKYRAAGIESYWLLDTFPERSRDYTAWCAAHLNKEDGGPEGKVPYIDDSFFATGPENRIFVTGGIQSIGLRTKKQTLYTTNNPEISLDAWVREALKGNYRNYLEETAAALHRKRKLRDRAAPALFRFRELYRLIIRDGTYMKKTITRYRILKNNGTLDREPALRKKFDDIYAEIDWLDREYRSMMSEGYGLFIWKRSRTHKAMLPRFRLESESKIRQIQACVNVLGQWEASFDAALGSLDREFPAGKKRRNA
jgi:competence protein CoiA